MSGATVDALALRLERRRPTAGAAAGGSADAAARQRDARRRPAAAARRAAAGTERETSIVTSLPDESAGREALERLRSLPPDRSTVLARIDSLKGDEPWPGDDELTADEVRAALAESDDARVTQVRSYERSHKNRAGVLKATERQAAA